MQLLLFKVLNLLASSDPIDVPSPEWITNIIEPIREILDTLMVPVLILVGTAGSIYAIVLGVNYSKAETSDKRDEAKKRMINAIIGIVVMLVLMILLKIFTDNAQNIVDWIESTVNESRR